MLINIITELFAKLKDGAGNAITSTDLGGGKRGLDVNASVSVSTDVRLLDASNASYMAKVDSYGRVYVYQSRLFGSIPIQFLYETSTSTAFNKNEWQDVLEYTVPSGWDLSAIEFSASSSQTLDDFRVVTRQIMGYFNTGTGVFTDASEYTDPQFASRIYLYVITTIGNVNDGTVTITYTNQAGTTGRTATVTLKKNTAAGTRLEIILQSGDYGIKNITNITYSVVQSGVFRICGTIDLVYITLQVANTEQLVILPNDSVSVPSEATLILQYRSSVENSKIRRENLIGVLLPR